MEHIWEPVFIHDSYACRKGKGVHAAVERLQQFLHRVTANGTRRAWFLQLDVRNYFMRIDKDILFSRLERKLRDEAALWLTRTLVYHDCTKDFVMRGNPALINAVPAHKTLFGAEAGKGLPIGNLNSQFFANVYLDGLDQFVKHELHCRYYLRYCDDFVLLNNDPEVLRDWRARIESYLHDELALELNPKQRLAPVSNGVDFLGYIVRRDYKLVRRRVVNNLKSKLASYEARLVSAPENLRCYRFDQVQLDALASTLSSYLGHFKPAASWRLRKALWQRFPYLEQYFDFDLDQWKLVRKAPLPTHLNTVRRQYRYLRWRFPQDALFFESGAFMSATISANRIGSCASV